MKPKKINYSSNFFKALKHLPTSELKNLERKENIFRENIFDPRLKTHKLKGSLKDFYSFSISYHWRIVFYLDKNSVVFEMIGTHQIYK